MVSPVVFRGSTILTIAMCYVSPEGVVFGADSTSSVTLDPGGFHYFNHAQKIFEIGEGSTVGLAIYGLGGLAEKSHRSLVAQLSDHLRATPPTSVSDVAVAWIDIFWAAYTAHPEYQPSTTRCVALEAKAPHDPTQPAAPGVRTKDEEDELLRIRLSLFVGFVIGGHMLPDRTPGAFEVQFDPARGKPVPVPVAIGSVAFRGAPNIIQRLLFGCDDEFFQNILDSPHWQGNAADLAAVRAKHILSHPLLPIRDAVDFVHSCIASTIKAFKFSNMSQVCGGPIELAVITTDRQFRWVRHKGWDAAVLEGNLQ